MFSRQNVIIRYIAQIIDHKQILYYQADKENEQNYFITSKVG